MRENRRIRKKKKERLNNRMALMGVTLVVMSLAAAVHLKGIELRQKDADYRYREEELATLHTVGDCVEFLTKRLDK